MKYRAYSITRDCTERPAPPGLLLSLGDGSAVEVTAEMLARAYIAAICRADRSHLEPEEARLSMARSMIEIAVQQAQEARDAG